MSPQTRLRIAKITTAVAMFGVGVLAILEGLHVDKRAAGWATLATIASFLVLLIPVINVLVLIAVMLPLWFINDLGFVKLGSPSNGFFEPNTLGWGLVALATWGLWYSFLLAAVLKKREAV